ncbi:unnamed protein product [Adineta steineri]|uniref:Uncharacterized protein n=1 Tax=Adineta steineri TaxID=433720 RepID=A0A818UL32_9BILA|nr:unnamed protein product [Adineta steineri]
MDPEPGEYRDFPEPNILVNDNAAHPFSSPLHAETMNRPLNDMPGIFDSSLYSDITFKNVQSDTNINNIETNKQIENNKPIQEYNFDSEENLFLTNIETSDLNERLHYLEIECERAQRITTHFENQLIIVKTAGEKLSLFCADCRSQIISTLNIHQNTDNFTYHEFEMLTTYAPDSDSITSDIGNKLLNKESDDYKSRLKYARSIMNLFQKAYKLRLQLSALNDILIKSVLSKNECFNEIEQSLHLPTKIFLEKNSLYDIFHYEITKQNIYIRCIHGQLIQDDINILCIENSKHLLSQINYNACEKYSYIFDIEFKRAITYLDQLTIAIPCFLLPTKLQLTNSSQQQIYIRCKRIMDPLIYIPALVEVYNDISYAVFRITQSLSAISVEAVLLYPFEVLRESQNGSYSLYTCEHSTVFQIETPKNYLIRPPRVRIIPFDSELIRYLSILKSEDQLLASSDLIELEWYKENKIEGLISITIPLTRQFNFFNETNEDLQKRRQKAQKKMSLQRQKFEQEKYDEAGGSLPTTPTSTHGLNTPTVISHLPSIAAIIERARTNPKENLIQPPKLNINRENNSQVTFKWNLDSFKNENAPIILLGYKNRKWKNCNNFVTITPTANKDVYNISLTSLIDRIILIRCWPESTNEGKFDKLAENLWSLTSAKLFSCVLARDPSFMNNNLGHYALIIVPIEKQTLAEDILRKRNYTEYIFNEQIIYENNSKTQLTKINQYQSYHTLSTRSSLHSIAKYVQFCLSEGTYIKIMPMGNIDVHEKVELSFRLHAQYPVILEFDIYPIDIYRQKTDDDFIGTLNIYQINTHNITLGSTASTLTAAAVSSRTSSGSKDLEVFDNLPVSSSPRTSINAPENLSNHTGITNRSNFERLTAHDLNETNLICSIRIRLPKIAFQLPSSQSNTIPIIVPNFFTEVIEALTEGQREFAEALNIHPALMNSLLISQYQRENSSQSNTSLYRHSKMTLSKDYNIKLEQTKPENETLLKWLKRQNVFQTNRTIDNIISALIHIGRVDLAYMFKVENLRNTCEHL